MTLTVRDAQLQQMADAQPGDRMVKPCADQVAWIEFRRVDPDGDPILGERCTVRLPDQSLQNGRLDRDGRVRFEGILPGTASISFPASSRRSGARSARRPPRPEQRQSGRRRQGHPDVRSLS